jgi:probable rRNA maturation factor
VVRQTLKKESLLKNSRIAICLVSHQRIRKINLKYLGKDTLTDVISFDLTDETLKSKGGIAADIIISTQAAISNARIFKTTYLYELLLYVVHGLLHVLGYDDSNKKQSRLMQQKAQAILKKINVHP